MSESAAAGQAPLGWAAAGVCGAEAGFPAVFLLRERLIRQCCGAAGAACVAGIVCHYLRLDAAGGILGADGGAGNQGLWSGAGLVVFSLAAWAVFLVMPSKAPTTWP